MNNKEDGAVLVVSLIFLSVLSIAAVTGMKSSITNERLSYNHQVNETSFQLADSGDKIAIKKKEWINDSFVTEVSRDYYSEELETEFEFNIRTKKVLRPGSSVSLSNAPLSHYLLNIESKVNHKSHATNIVRGYVRIAPQ